MLDHTMYVKDLIQQSILTEIVMVISIICFFAWITQIIECYLERKLVFLLISLLIPPVGIVYGIGLWLVPND